MSLTNTEHNLESTEERLVSALWDKYKDNPDEILTPASDDAFNKLINVYIEGKNRGKSEVKDQLNQEIQKFIKNVFSDLQHVKTKFEINSQFLAKEGINDIKPYFDPIISNEGITLRFLMLIEEDSYNNSEKRKLIYQSYRNLKSELQKHIHASFTYLPNTKELNTDRVIFDGYKEFY